MPNESYVIDAHNMIFDHYRPPNDGPGRSHVAKRQTRVTRTPNSIVVSNQGLRVGQSAKGIAWSRWETQGLTVLKAKTLVDGSKSINLMNKSVVREGGRIHTHFSNRTTYIQTVETYGAIVARTGNPEMFFDFIEEHTGYRYTGIYGDKAFRSLLPAVNLWYADAPVHRGELSLNLINKPMHEPTIEGFVRSLYGKTRYRKDLVRAVANTRLDHINNLSIVIGAVPIDWQIEALRMSTEFPEHGTVFLDSLNRDAGRKFRTILRGMTAPRQRRLVHELVASPVGGNRITIDDTFRMLQRYDLSQASAALYAARTFEELHRAIAPNRGIGGTRNYIPPVFVNQSIRLNRAIETINAVEMPNTQFICAKDTQTMRDWGEYMHNCIGSYDYSAVNGDSIYIGAYQGDELVANIELSKKGETSYDLRQILGKYNKNLDETLRIKLIDGLKSTGIVNEKSIVSAWGMEPPIQMINNQMQIAQYAQADIALNVVAQNAYAGNPF